MIVKWQFKWIKFKIFQLWHFKFTLSKHEYFQNCLILMLQFRAFSVPTWTMCVMPITAFCFNRFYFFWSWSRIDRAFLNDSIRCTLVDVITPEFRLVCHRYCHHEPQEPFWILLSGGTTLEQQCRRSLSQLSKIYRPTWSFFLLKIVFSCQNFCIHSARHFSRPFFVEYLRPHCVSPSNLCVFFSEPR